MERFFSDPERKQFFRIAQADIAHRFQKTGRYGEMDAIRSGTSAFPAFQETCGDIEGIRGLRSAHVTAKEVRRITGKAGYPKLKNRFDQSFLQG